MRIGIFGGTREGRILAERLEESGYACETTLFVATDYGVRALAGIRRASVLCGRKDAAQMAACLRERDIRLVIDATHPFAREASANIRAAAAACGCRLERLVRESVRPEAYLSPERCLMVTSVAQAADALCFRPGNALVTTGSKEAAAYRALPDFASRLFLRVLPGEAPLRRLTELGFRPERIVQGEGPFSREENRALLRETGVSFLITKDSGAGGGTAEKLQAAADCGVRVILIQRTPEEGKSLEEIWRQIVREGESGVCGSGTEKRLR